mmetsp:Transcript_124924/g.266626  ORF Transcript_124924/g.266626 Transcript_124924/m.266626 type:complete len:200 (-) Transcript_124924:3681-4280(-)
MPQSSRRSSGSWRRSTRSSSGAACLAPRAVPPPCQKASPASRSWCARQRRPEKRRCGKGRRASSCRESCRKWSARCASATQPSWLSVRRWNAYATSLSSSRARTRACWHRLRISRLPRRPRRIARRGQSGPSRSWRPTHVMWPGSLPCWCTRTGGSPAPCRLAHQAPLSLRSWRRTGEHSARCRTSPSRMRRSGGPWRS